MRSDCIDLTGERFGAWTVLHKLSRPGQKKIKWECQCDCGTIAEVDGQLLRIGRSTRCSKCRAASGERTRRPEARIWRGMKARCYNKNSASYLYYGALGIRVCDRWLNSLDAFLEDMGPRPSNEHSIERINNDGDYCPENCKWATIQEQANNRSSRRTLTVNGVTKSHSEWANEIGISRERLRQRVKAGMSPQDAIAPRKFRSEYTPSLVKSRVQHWTKTYKSLVIDALREEGSI